MAAGRKPNVERRRRMVALRDQGMSLPEIGRRLGVTYQFVQKSLHAMANAKPRSVACYSCGRIIFSEGALEQDRKTALCLACLAVRPDAPFGQRLKAYRLAAGLTRSELAKRAGLEPGMVQLYEDVGHEPRWGSLIKLMRVLGARMVTLGLAEERFDWRRRKLD